MTGRYLLALYLIIRLYNLCSLWWFNPFNPNSGQHQISPSSIKACLTPEVMRIKDMITEGEFS